MSAKNKTTKGKKKYTPWKDLGFTRISIDLNKEEAKMLDSLSDLTKIVKPNPSATLILKAVLHYAAQDEETRSKIKAIIREYLAAQIG